MVRVEISKNNYRDFASVNDIREVFHEHRAELEWLAYLITGDRAAAAACVTDACAWSEARNSVFRQWLLTWAKHATIRSALDTQLDLIKEESKNYEYTSFLRCCHEPLARDLLEVLVHEPDVVVRTMDVLSRTTLLICGVQQNPIADAAVMLGVSRVVASAAYYAALECLEEIACERLERNHSSQVLMH